MTTQNSDDDFLREVATALKEAEHLAEPVRAAGRAAWMFRGFDEELAALTYDSLVGAGPAVRAGGDGGRILLFSGPSAEVQVEHDDGVVVGQLVPPAPGRLTVEGRSGYRTESEVDEMGCFSFGPPSAEPVRLHLQAGGFALVTDWIRF